MQEIFCGFEAVQDKGPYWLSLDQHPTNKCILCKFVEQTGQVPSKLYLIPIRVRFLNFQVDSTQVVSDNEDFHDLVYQSNTLFSYSDVLFLHLRS